MGSCESVSEFGHQMDERSIGLLQSFLGFVEPATGANVRGCSRRQIGTSHFRPILLRLRTGPRRVFRRAAGSEYRQSRFGNSCCETGTELSVSGIRGLPGVALAGAKW